MTRLSHMFKTWLSHRLFGVWMAVLAVLLMLPSLWGGFAADDHFMRLVLQGSEELPEFQGSHNDVFVFGRSEPDVIQARAERGILPWWTAPNGRLAFWRPLASLSHWLDFQLYPKFPSLMHLHNLLWYAAVALMATALFRRFLTPTWVAGLAALLYVADDAHSFAVGWLSNRNSVMATVFGILVLLVHDRWRKDHWRLGSLLAPLCLVAGLCCAEAAMAIGGYLAAYALFLDKGSWRSRLFSLVPYGALVLPWLVVYKRLGFGTIGSGLYTDPFGETFLFLKEAPARLILLLLGQLGTPTSSLWPFYPWSLAVAQLILAVVFTLFVAWVLWPLLRRDALARFWAIGMVLSLFPFCATFPNDRHLFFAGLGGMALVAQFFQAWLSPADSRFVLAGRRYSARVLGICWIGIHCVFSPLWMPMSGLTIAGVGTIVERAAKSLPQGEDVRGMDVVVLNTPSDFLCFYVPVMRAACGEPLPRHLWTLFAGIESVEVKRPDARTLELTPTGGFLPPSWSRMFRSSAYPFQAGENIDLDELQVKVLTVTDEGLPAEVRFTFDRPLDDPTFRFFVWKDGCYQPFELPPVGGGGVLPAFPWTWFLS